MKENKTEVVKTNLTPAQHQEFMAIAQSKGLAIGTLTRQIILEYIKKEKQKNE